MVGLREIVLDCADADALGAFWATALGYENLGRAGSYVALKDPHDGPMLILQEVSEAKVIKNRVHFDVEADDIRAEARRLEAMGATLLNDRKPIQEHSTQWMVLLDPQGNEFCICQIGKVPEDDDAYPAAAK